MKRHFFLVLLFISSVASAATIPSDRLYDTNNVRHVSLSRSADMVAAIVSEQGSRSKFVLFERKNGKLNPIWKINSSESQHIAGYKWLSNGDILLNYDVEVSAALMADRFCDPHSPGCYGPADPNTNDRFSKAFSILRIANHIATVPQMYDSLVKEPWQDSDSILVSVKTVADSTCLMVRNMRLSHGDICISKPLTLIKQNYFALSDSEVYVLGVDSHGKRIESQLDLESGKWLPMAAGTVIAKLKEMGKRFEPSEEILSRVHELGLDGGEYVRTHDGRVVGYREPAPRPGFTSLDPGLDKLQTLLEERYPEHRFNVTLVSEDLQHAFVEVWKDGVPVRGIFYDAPSSFTEYPELSPKVSDSELGRVHFERKWVNEPVAVTMPPAGLPVTGVIVVPFTTRVERREEQLHFYNADYQIFAKNGIAVAMVLLPVPSLNGDTAAGAQWRTTAASDVSIVVDRVSKDLLGGRSVCLYGDAEDGSLALEFGGLAKVGCVIAQSPWFDSALFSNNGGDPKVTPDLTAFKSNNTAVALYGDSDQAAPFINSSNWIQGLPKDVMLVVNRNDRNGNFNADRASEFLDELKKSGRQASLYAPQPVSWADEPRYAVALSDNMAKFAVKYFKSSGVSTK